jgi:hypothetical protein
MPINELYNAIDPQGVVLNARVFGKGTVYPNGDPFGSVSGQFPNAYNFAKRFVTPSYDVQGNGNGVTSIDDPTYLGFSLRFDISSPLFNGAVSKNSAIPVITDQSSSLFDVGDNSTQKNKLFIGGESAVGYLEAIGETTRASYLMAFIQGIREINLSRPYYWQTIEGLSEAWDKTFNMEDPFSGSSDTEGITIDCLEAMDLKISALFNLYKSAVYDVKHKRTILPKNLMYFNVYVDVLEIRKFKTIKNWLTRGNVSNQSDDTTKLINENTASITFLFEDCIWDLSSAGALFSGVTNAGGNDMSKMSMKWKYSKVEVESQFPGYTSALSDSVNLQPKNLGGGINTDSRSVAKKILDNANSAAKSTIDKTLSNLKKGTINKVERVARSLIQKPLLGNVFGQRNQILAAIQNPQLLINAVAGAAAQLGILSNSNFSTPNSLSLGEPVNSGQPNRLPTGLNSTNVYNRGPSGPPPLSSNNVFKQ